VIDKLNRSGENYPSFVEILNEMNQEGGFTRSVLATEEGLPIAADPVDTGIELASAMVSVLQQVAAETRNQLELPPIDEITIRTDQKYHLICRPIQLGNEIMIMGVIVPPNKAYRRVTNKTINRLKKVI
jgi:predicted regulator of Ras-like GTPase activity (Roadblock/LC7/MglB family)